MIVVNYLLIIHAVENYLGELIKMYSHFLIMRRAICVYTYI